MKGLLRRLSVGLVTATLCTLAVGASAAAEPGQADAGPMAVGSRLANGDGDTTGECLEIDAGGTSTTTVVMRTCHTNAHQSWYFTAHTGGVIAIRSHDPDAAGRCLTAGVFQDLPVRMAACPTVGAPQAWHIVGDPDGWFQLRNHAYSDQCLDVSANGLGDVVKTWGCRTTSNGNQLWKWRSVG